MAGQREYISNLIRAMHREQLLTVSAYRIEKLSNFDTAKATWKRGETLEQQSSGQKGWFGWLW